MALIPHSGALMGHQPVNLKCKQQKKTQELQRFSPKKLQDLAASQLENIDIALWQHTVQQRGKVGPPWGPEITMNEILPPMHTHTHTHTHVHHSYYRRYRSMKQEDSADVQQDDAH